MKRTALLCLVINFMECFTYQKINPYSNLYGHFTAITSKTFQGAEVLPNSIISRSYDQISKYWTAALDKNITEGLNLHESI